MALLTAVSWWLFYVCTQQIIKSVDKSIYLSMIYTTSFTFWMGLFFVMNKSRPTLESVNNVKWWLLCAVACQILGNYLSLKAVELKNATYASVVEISYPIWCAMFSLALLGQNTLTLRSLIGFWLGLWCLF